MGSGIQPHAIPGADLDPDGVGAAAISLSSGGGSVRDAGADVVGKWRGLGVHYEAPESGQLFSVMDPVETSARAFGDAVQQVATVLKAYAEEIRPIKASLDAVRRDAYAFRDKIASNSEWEYDQDLVDENTDLVNRVNSAQVKLWDAERTCANGIRALYGAASWHAATSEDDPLGYGIDEIPADAEMAWGSSVERKDHCPKSAAVGVKEFVWDGLVVDGLGGTLVGLGALVGIQDWSWSWETMKTTWTAMGGLIGYADGEWSWGNAGDSWLGMGKGLISYDAWHEGDGARGLGGAVFNIGTFFIPVAGQAAGVVKGGALAAKSGRAASWLAKGARIADFVDPVALALKGGKLVLPKLDDLLAGMRGATEGLTDAMRVPDMPTNLDLPTSGLDDLADGLPPVRDPDVEVPTVREPVEVPAHQLVGPDGTPIRDTPGGSGSGADDLAGPQAPPAGPIHAPGTDAPTGGSSHGGGSDGGSSGGDGTGGGSTPGSGTPGDGPGGGELPPRRVWSPDDEPIRTVPATEAPRPYTDADVQRAWDDAPVDGEGRPVDHRTGEPLGETRADDARGWHMTWDPEHQTWVAERPGTGYPAPGTMPDHGVPGSFGYDENGALLKYANSRPEYAPGQVEAVWDAAPQRIDEDGNPYVRVTDADGEHVRVYWEPGQPREGLWDMGHVPEREYRTLREQYLEHEITLEQFLAEYRDPDNYGVTHPGRNRSHVDEA